jgi:hypothetical protein
VTWPQGKKFPPKKYCYGEFFASMQSLKDMDVLHSGAAEALADLFQPDTDAPAEYFKIYERKPGLEPEKKLMLAVLEDAIGCFQNFVCATDNRQKKWFLEAEEWFTEEESEWIFSFENICDVLRLDPQYLRQGLISWKRKRLAGGVVESRQASCCIKAAVSVIQRRPMVDNDRSAR